MKYCLLLFLFLLSALSAEELVILQTTDLHGTTDTDGLLEIIAREREEHPDLLLIDCGDLMQGTYQAAQDKGAAAVEYLNRAEYDVFVPGNHDFDYGADVLCRNLGTLKNTAVLAANLRLPLRYYEGNYFQSWKLFLRNGRRIAVIGIAPVYLDQWLGPLQLQGIGTESVEDTLTRLMPEIRKAKPDLVILAIHQGLYTSKRLTGSEKMLSIQNLLQMFQEITLVLGGHSHMSVPGKSLYPDFWYVQAPPHGQGIVKITVSDDRQITSRLLLNPGKENSAEPKNESAEKRITGTELADLFADAVLKTVQEADGVLTGTFIAGSGLPAGKKIRESDLFRTIPFENMITVLTLTKEQLDAVIAEQKMQKDKQSRLRCVSRSADAEQKNVFRLAVTSYAAAGAGGRYPVLRKIAQSQSGTGKRHDLPLTIRDAVRTYLRSQNCMK